MNSSTIKSLPGLTGAVIATAVVVAAGSGQPQQPAPFTTGTALVVVPAVVTDGRERIVASLRAEDFEVREDGTVMPITSFVRPDSASAAGGSSGRFLVLLLDDLRVDPTNAWRVKELAREFVKRMRVDDVLTVIRLNGDQAVSSNRPQELLAAINRFGSFGDGTGRAEWDVRHAMETIGSLAAQMADSSHPRKVLVVIGSAGLFSPEAPMDGIAGSGPERSSMAQFPPWWLDAIRDTSRRNVSVYVIDPSGAAGPGGPFAAYDGAHSFAFETGGAAFARSNNFDRAIQQIWQDSGEYYLLGYAAPIADQRPHRIEVTVKPKGLQVRARRSRG